jgi:hypothetical protein
MNRCERLRDRDLRDQIEDLYRAAGVLVAVADGEPPHTLGVMASVEAVRAAARTLADLRIDLHDERERSLAHISSPGSAEEDSWRASP